MKETTSHKYEFDILNIKKALLEYLNIPISTIDDMSYAVNIEIYPDSNIIDLQIAHPSDIDFEGLVPAISNN